jgi:acyl dehydratase
VADLPLDRPLQVQAQLKSLQLADNRARLVVRVATGTEDNPERVVAEMHQLFILGKSTGRSLPRTSPERQWHRLGRWNAVEKDGIRFALLTGDFNPIHWVPLAGALSPFKGMVLHGFGTFARTFEILARTMDVGLIDVRFLKPVRLPSEGLSVELAAADDGRDEIRLMGTSGELHLAGTCRATPRGVQRSG